MYWRLVVPLALVVLSLVALLATTNNPLPLEVRIVRVYDVGNTGYWDVIELNVTNLYHTPVQAVFLVDMYNSEKRWLVGSTVFPYAPLNGSDVAVIPPDSSVLINISAPSPQYFIPPFTPIFVQVYGLNSYSSTVSPVYITPNTTRPPVVNPCFKILYYSGKYNNLLPWGWYLFMTPNTTITYTQEGLVVNGTMVLYQPTFASNVYIVGENVYYTIQGHLLIIVIHNGYVRCVKW